MSFADDCIDIPLDSVIGFTGSVLRGLQFTACGKCLAYPLGSLVVLRSIESGLHSFLDAAVNHDISCLALSKDGRYLATGHTMDGTVKVETVLWDLRSAIDRLHKGNFLSANTTNHSHNLDKNSFLLHRLYQHRGRVQDIDFSFDGSYLVTLGGQDDNDIVVWDVKAGKAICGHPAAKETARCVRWLNHRNDRFVTCGNNHFRVWQLCAATPLLHAVDANMGCIRRVIQCVCISNDDRFGFAGTQTGEVLKFSLDRDEINQGHVGLNELVPNLREYSTDRFSKGVKSVVCIINPTTGNTNLIAGAGDGTLQLLNPKLQPIPSHRIQLNGAVTSITLSSRDSKHFQAGTEFSHRYSIEVATFSNELRSTSHFSKIYDVKFPQKSSEIFVTASDQDIRIWNTKQRQEILRIQVQNLSCFAMAIIPSGTCIVSGWSDGKIRAFYPETGKSKFIIPDAHQEAVTALALCADNDRKNESDWRIVSGGKEGAIRVWKVKDSHQCLQHSMKEHRGQINALSCNAEGSQVISSSNDGSCIVWDLNKGIRIHALFEPTSFTGVLFHPDESQYLTCSSNFKIGYWDAFDGSCIRSIEGGMLEMTCIDIQPDGNLFVSGSADRCVRVWHYDDGLTIGIGRLHSGTVNSIAISPDQKYVVSVGDEGGIYIWNISGICTK